MHQRSCENIGTVESAARTGLSQRSEGCNHHITRLIRIWKGNTGLSGDIQDELDRGCTQDFQRQRREM